MPESIFIGIHGLKNKPAKDLLARWWAQSLAEGLHRNHALTASLPFELVYWADVQYPVPIPEPEIDNPYIKAQGQGPLRRYDGSALDKVRAIAEKWGGRTIDKGKDLIGLSPEVDRLLGMPFDDLRDYYRDPDVRTKIRARLTSVLLQHHGKRVCLVAHSMGSIIAYDVLRTLERQPQTIDHFVSLGSPLDLPIVTQHIRGEFSKTTVPQQVKQWTNLADPGDKVALDCSLADDYQAAHSSVQVQDVLVCNDYVDRTGKNDRHNSYGYLRTPELSDVIRVFLTAGSGV